MLHVDWLLQFHTFIVLYKLLGGAAVDSAVSLVSHCKNELAIYL